MIVRRYDRATGEEAKPFTINEAARVIACSMSANPSRKIVSDIAADLEAGQQRRTAGFLYVPDADMSFADAPGPNIEVR